MGRISNTAFWIRPSILQSSGSYFRFWSKLFANKRLTDSTIATIILESTFHMLIISGAIRSKYLCTCFISFSTFTRLSSCGTVISTTIGALIGLLALYHFCLHKHVNDNRSIRFEQSMTIIKNDAGLCL